MWIHNEIASDASEIDVINSAQDIVRNEEARKRILRRPHYLVCRDVQELCKANGLLARGKAEILRERLLGWFRLFEGLELLSEEEILKRYEDVFSVSRKEGNQPRHKFFERVFRVLHPDKQDFSESDLIRLEIASKLRAVFRAKNERVFILGQFYASPSPSNRARCRHCNEMITKGSVRVSAYYPFKSSRWNKKSHRWSQSSWSQLHFHAECFVNRESPDELKVKFGKTKSFEDLSIEDQRRLRDEIIDTNAWALGGKGEWPDEFRYPTNAIEFRDLP